MKSLKTIFHSEKKERKEGLKQQSKGKETIKRIMMSKYEWLSIRLKTQNYLS